MSTNSDIDYTSPLLWTPPSYQDDDEIEGQEVGINNQFGVRSLVTSTATPPSTTTATTDSTSQSQDRVEEEEVFDQSAEEYMNMDISEFMKNQNDEFLMGTGDDGIGGIGAPMPMSMPIPIRVSSLRSSVVIITPSGGETTQESSLDDSDGDGEDKTDDDNDDDDLDTSMEMEDRELVIDDSHSQNESQGDTTDYEEDLGSRIDEINLYSQSYKAASTTDDDETTQESSQEDEDENVNDGDLDSSMEDKELIIDEQNHGTLGHDYGYLIQPSGSDQDIGEINLFSQSSSLKGPTSGEGTGQESSLEDETDIQNIEDKEVVLVGQNDNDTLDGDGSLGYRYLLQQPGQDQGIDEMTLYSSSIMKDSDEEFETTLESSQDDEAFGEGFEILGEIIDVPNSNQTVDYDENKGQEVEGLKMDQETGAIKVDDEGKELVGEEEKPHVEPTLKSLLIQFKEEFENKEQEYEESLTQHWISNLFPQFHGTKNYKEEKKLGIPFFRPAHEDEDDELLLGYKSRPSINHKSMCLLCYKWVLGEKELAEHMAVKHPQLYFYKCRICCKRFLAPFQRSRHEKIHQYDMKFPYNFYTPSDDLPLDYYVPNHWRKRLRPALFSYSYINSLEESAKQLQKWDCMMCDWVFDNEEDLTEHYDLAHKTQECQYCYEKLENGIEFQKHLKKVHEIEPAVNYEGGMFAVLNDMEESYADLMSTIEEDHCYARPRYDEPRIGGKRSKKEPPRLVNYKYYDSDEESRRSSSNSNFSSPSSSGITLIERRARRRDNFCKLCNEDFVTSEIYVRHMADVHATEKPYACSYCHRRFGTASNKKEHERIHTGERPYKCVICDRGFTQISNLKKHISTHGEENHLKCQVCAKQFIKETSLILHQRAHAADRKYKCTICSRAYNYSSLLTRHMRLHTGDMPYSCYECGKLFHESLLLDYHIKKYHTGERIKCIHCEKAFILPSDLKKHLKIHARQGLPMPSDFMSDDEDDELGEEEEEEEFEDGSFLDKTSEEEVYINEMEMMEHEEQQQQ